MNTGKLEIKLMALITKCRGLESKEAIGNHIIECANDIVNDFSIPVVMRSAFKETLDKWHETKDDAELGNWLFAKSKGIEL